MLPPTFSRYAPCRRVPAKHLDPLTPLSARAIPSVGWAVLLFRGTYWTHSHYSHTLQLLIRTFVYSTIYAVDVRPSNGKQSLNVVTHHSLKKQSQNSIDMKTFYAISTLKPNLTAIATSLNGSIHLATLKNNVYSYLTYSSLLIRTHHAMNLKQGFSKTSNSLILRFAYTNSKLAYTLKHFTNYILAGFRYSTLSLSQTITMNVFSPKAAEISKITLTDLNTQ